jgi:hypothetical protein
MKEHCLEFRSRLSSILEGFQREKGQWAPESQARDMQTLGWHEHLLHCGECRQLLQSEQVLDELLGGLPTPVLSASQRANLILRLNENLKLERLLDVADPYQGAPAGLSERVLQGLRSHTLQSSSVSGKASLDQHLAELETVAVPPGLAARVLQYCREHGPAKLVELKPQRAQSSHMPGRKAPVLRHWLTSGLVAASLAAVLWYLPGMFKSDPETPKNLATNQDPLDVPAEDAEILALLDSLEVMDLVNELDAEEWELVDQYDSYALFLVEDRNSTDGEAR